VGAGSAGFAGPRGLSAAGVPLGSPLPSVPGLTPPAPRGGRGFLIAGIVALVIALLAAGGVVYLLNRGGDGAAGPKPSSQASAGPIGPWERRADLPVSVEGAAVAAWNGKLWVAGGQRNNDVRLKIKEVYVYDPATNAWTAGPPLPKQISHASLVPTPKGLFFVAGWLVDGGSTQVLRLNDAGTGWEEQPALPESRVFGVAGYTGTELVFAGGTRSGAQPEPADTVWALRDNAWVEIGKLQTPRQKLVAAGNGADNLWVLGGRNVTTNEKFGTIDVIARNGVQQTRRVLEPPIDSAAGAYVEGSGVCLVGGQTPNGGFNDWWCEERGLAARLPALDPQRASLGAAMIGRTLYVVGGYGNGFFDLNRLEAITFPPR
jgi:hypothetical protein